MKTTIKKNMRFMITLILILMVLVTLIIYEINTIQGNGRVVNYAGIIRGATQKLVKNELYGDYNDSEIERLDDILLGLQTGKGSQNLTVLKDPAYLAKLHMLAAEWENLKATIYAARKDASKCHDLYQQSDNYFVLANDTVAAAEVYSDGIAKKLNVLESAIIIDILLIIALLSTQIASEIRNNRKLSRIAYVDPQTGLPNKRSCDEKLNDVVLIEPTQNVCCIMFDLNNLKITNDTYGHEVGDVLITGFASMLRRNMPEDMFIGRFGGDEFIGIQMNADKDIIIHTIEKMQTETNQLYINPDVSNMHINFAVGYAFSNEHADCTVKTLMNIADRNMYLNKAAIKKQTV